MAEHEPDEDDLTSGDLDALIKPLPSSSDCLAKEVLSGALNAKTKALIARGSSVIILKVPDADWVELLATSAARLAKHVLVYSATERKSVSKVDVPVGADDLRAVQRGRCVIYICQDPEAILDPAVLTAADMTVTIPTPSVLVLRKVIRMATGGVARGVSAEMAALPMSAIVNAIRPGISARECVANLRRAIVPPEVKIAPTVPSLHKLPLTATVRDWANATLSELAAVHDGTLAPDALLYGVLDGRPGTGKTLIARSLAETSGWAFVPSSVGGWFTRGDGHLGSVAKNVKAFIDRAIANEPAIAFLDELDALPDRAALDARGRDWWVPVITLVLTEIDRLRLSGKRVLLLGATNYYERMDDALVRPGRMQQRIRVHAPETTKETTDLFRFYLGSDLDEANVVAMAELVSGATPAMVEGWVREARAIARGAGRSLAAEDVISRIIPKDDRLPADIRAIALHEAGHAIIAHRLGHKVGLVSIVPQGNTGGHVRSSLPTLVPTSSDVRDMVTVMLGGRAADLVLGSGASTGAANDLENATRLLIDAREKQGMGESLLYGPVARGKPSAGTIAAVTGELKELLQRAIGLLVDHRELAVLLADRLAREKVLSGKELAALLGMPPCSGDTGTADNQDAGGHPTLSQVSA